jgi:hypothetical protein
MTDVVVDLLPRDAELARRAAGGDGAAFVRLFDHYSDEVFEASLAATGSIEGAAEATQRAFLRILRWPPAFGADDGDVVELLYALAFGGEHVPVPETPDTVDARQIARLVGVGWLRSETVAKGGARFDADWSEYLWADPPQAESEPAQPRKARSPKARRRRLRLALPRPALPRIAFPSPATAAAVPVLTLVATGAGMIFAQGGTVSTSAQPEAAIDERVDKPRQDSQPAKDAARRSRDAASRFEKLLLAP